MQDFRWRAFFRRTRDPLFLLSRQQRFLFVNTAWQRLTGLKAAKVRGLGCLKRPTDSQDPWEVVVRALCCPPAEVLAGKIGQARRLVPGALPQRRWWDLKFFPIQGENGILGILGTITVVPAPLQTSVPPLPEQLINLRRLHQERFASDFLTSELPAMRRLADQIRLAAQSHVPAILLGEPGTGKAWLARAIHARGEDRERPFVGLDCARIPTEALTALLFGASSHLHRSHRGTLYLARPHAMARDLQARVIPVVLSG